MVLSWGRGRPNVGWPGRWFRRSTFYARTRQVIDPKMFVPAKAFLTKGVGRHKEKLTSFELALRDAHIAQYNLVRVSSIFPPNCQIVSWEQGNKMLSPGQVVFAVVAEPPPNEPSRLAAASIGLAIPADPNHHGYISEHHAFGDV